MNSRASTRFWNCYARLPERIQQLTRKNFALWKLNPSHPSLHFKEIKPRLWSARVGLNHRALAAFDGMTYIWFWIGTHNDYLRLISST